MSEEEETLTMFLDFTINDKSALHTLTCNFEGTLDEDLKGFYRSKSFTKDGNVCYGAVTQFEPADARRCFPWYVTLSEYSCSFIQPL